MRQKIYDQIDAERERQDEEWGGIEHDREHCLAEWIDYIEKQIRLAHWADFIGNETDVRDRLIKISALAVAALEAEVWLRRLEHTLETDQDIDMRSSCSIEDLETTWNGEPSDS